MSRLRPHRKSISSNYLEELEALSPPAPSKNLDFQEVHDELLMLQNVAQVHLGIVAEECGGRMVSWIKFIKDFTPHRKLSSDEQIEEFLKSKLYSKKDARR